MTSLLVTCLICGDIHIDPEDLTLIVEGSGCDYSFIHCDTETRRHASKAQVAVLLPLGVRVVHTGAHCSCGLRRFNVNGVLACRICDAPMPGLPGVAA
jgi:hypothetical protein